MALEVPEPVGTLIVANHFPSWKLAFEHERGLQAVAAATAIEQLAGDCQTQRARPTRPRTRCWRPFQRIDYILVRCGLHGGPTLSIQDCTRIFDDPPASDDYGVIADLATLTEEPS